jgi:pimeloyl-ACP methyl ester carboxylesterase
MREQRGFLRVEAQQLEYLWSGPGPEEKPTLVFLHEGLGCVEMWGDFPAQLAEATGWGALVYSRIGYGRSERCTLPRPLEYMHDEGHRVLPAVLETRGVRECVLIGHSDGGSIALIYAGGTPAHPLRGLITEAAHVFNEDVCVRAVQQIRRRFERGDLRERLAKYHGSNTDCAFLGWCDAWLDPGFQSWNLEEFLPAIQVPWLVIQGEDDDYGTLAQVEAIAAGAGGETELLIVPQCQHVPHQDQKALVLERMSHFVRGLAGT